MYDWSVAADIYRLDKGAGQASTADEPRELDGLADAEAQRIAANPANPVAASQRAVERSLELLRMPFSKLRD